MLILLMAAAWFYMTFDTQSRIEHIVEAQTKIRAIFAMRDAALKRTIALNYMTLLEDEFDRDDEHMKLKELAGDFMQARDIFLDAESHKPHSQVMQLWKKVAIDIRTAEYTQAQVVNLVLEGNFSRANQILLNIAVPTQNTVLQQLTALLELQRQRAEEEVGEIYKRNTTGLIFISIVAIWTIFWGVRIAGSTVRRISRIEDSLDKARLTAQEADQQKSQFLANMSHEIRTPLTAIIGYSETLIENKQNIPEWKQYVGSIIRNGKHLHQLLDDILDLSKIDANQLSIESIPVSVCNLATEIESLMGERARKKGLEFVLDYNFPIPATILSDPTRLKQILINLCGNAIKFTAEGRITLRTQYDKTKERLVFSIEDTGIGMTQKQVDTLFKPFKQADASTTRRFGGTGLGLHISKQLTEHLGGELLLESQPGAGSKFIVAIKAKITADEKWVNSEEEASLLTQNIQLETSTPELQGKILLAEDNTDNQILISMHVEKTGADITIVENGQQAVETALDEHFDLILMDMQMPIMDGIEAIKTLRKKQYKAPIATLTANAMKEDIETSKQAGADDFLTKPIDKKIFYSVLIKHLSPATDAQNSGNKSTPTNDLDDISDLVDRYIKLLPETFDRIELFVRSREWEEVKDEIHRLKGTGGAFGLPEVTEQCTEIEKYLLMKNYEPAQQLINQLGEFCMGVVENHIPLHPSTGSKA